MNCCRDCASISPIPCKTSRRRAGWKSVLAAANIWRIRRHFTAHVSFIGAEPFVNGVAKLLALIEEKQLAQYAHSRWRCALFAGGFAGWRFERVYLLYPDPWPKARHNKRRFVSAENLGADLPRPDAWWAVPVRQRHCRLCGMDARSMWRPMAGLRKRAMPPSLSRTGLKPATKPRPGARGGGRAICGSGAPNLRRWSRS